jgi:hypothetical protein
VTRLAGYGTRRGVGLEYAAILEARRIVQAGERVMFAAPDRASAERIRKRVREMFTEEELRLVSFTSPEDAAPV